jgi:hypothetical protein
MQYFNEEAAFYITITSNIAYALLFVYHFVNKNPNKSLMILTGYMCLNMVFMHVLLSYEGSLDRTSDQYYSLFNNYYLIWMIQASITFLAIFWTHKLLKTEFHYVIRYVLRGLVMILALNMAMHIDIIEMGNREYYWLWTVFSYGENVVNLFMFLSILIARKWSEIFKWLQLAHSRYH